MISQHFSEGEFACKDGTPYPTGNGWDQRKLRLATVLEVIRNEWKRSITLTSVYRTPAWNAKQGGETGSLHLQGLAADILPPSGVEVFDFWTRITELAPILLIGGIGYAPPSYGGFVHVDLRTAVPGSWAKWTYPLH